ncbi:dTDP-4-dehydrorhamnose reductase [Vibrio navarrensis]|uniref:dTDP-4-dehydrorhamnose reductase n=1 Tax=Vibrio navarrensis TaxID=29495 RepID=UPI00051D1DF5|nr:dTDP-4-dehydrorhamnose reductase [Vibrio navarrensis]KGK17389.1 dTDP-4-dehydrorhamnose reductase [Vibrio navarrensis]MBE4582206.1 dTDP-4-dehydrorhamnose reductase [Vibrio navarrensis]MBE4609466.1 dTDP-4-dehydrorhamnose reductase [Vibrio navarrensis]MBE4613051.1 dTDP-4-dehydrorhamnose reductase [Vibrio navarrensis]
MRVVITGADGQLGQCLVRQLKGRTEVFPLNREQLDICDGRSVEEIFSSLKPDIVVNTAAYTAVDKAESDPEVAYLANEQGPKLLAKACHKYGSTLIHISTDYVFNGNKQTSYVEQDRPDPCNVYGMSKLAGEKAVQSCCSQYYILRTSWVFSEFGSNFVKTMLKLGREREQLGIVADQFGGPTYAGDISLVISQLIEHLERNDVLDYGIYHFSGEPYVSWFEFAQEIFSLAYKQGVIKKEVLLKPLSTLEYPTAAKRPNNSRLSNQKIETHLKLGPKSWKSALKQLDIYMEQ